MANTERLHGAGLRPATLSNWTDAEWNRLLNTGTVFKLEDVE